MTPDPNHSVIDPIYQDLDTDNNSIGDSLSYNNTDIESDATAAQTVKDGAFKDKDWGNPGKNYGSQN